VFVLPRHAAPLGILWATEQLKALSKATRVPQSVYLREALDRSAEEVRRHVAQSSKMSLWLPREIN
jgi:hypothetical protein